VGRAKRTRELVEADLLASSLALELGRQVRTSRVRRHLTQRALASRVGLRQPRISGIERGEGATATLRTWVSIGGALGRPFRIELARDPVAEVADAGHLAIQELLLRLGRQVGRSRSFELPTRPAEPARSVDVCLRDDRHRVLIVVEAWNTIGDIGAAVRSTRRKLAEADELAVARGDGSPCRVAAAWVLRASRRNRELVARYPEVFAAAFPGSSAGWARALSSGTAPPDETGLVWCDVAATRLFAWRRPPPG
jgi:transcriptional regulator with XRE-family HTH domain